MDFMMDEELDGYFVLILFMLKMKNSLSSKKCKRFWVREIFKKRAAYGIYNSLVHELRIGIEFCFKSVLRMTFFFEISKLYKQISNSYK